MIQGDELIIQECELLSKLIKQKYKEGWDCYSVFVKPFLLLPLLIEGLLHYIVLFGPS